ncbi:uncharacterized protein ly97.3 isoform X1 [Festucalex cinctus]
MVNVTMKLLLLALSVTLLFIAGEALKCRHCVPRAPGEDCELTVETCNPEKDGCAAAKFRLYPHGRYQKCMALSDCKLLELNNFIEMKCCNDDMCNTFL